MNNSWQKWVRPLLFRTDPERIHHVAMTSLHQSFRLPLVRNKAKKHLFLTDPRLKTTCFGLSFPAPVGLAAGFDKEGVWINTLSALGFGSIEIGTITGQAQPGNPKPRLFRLPKDQAVLNRMGFNNRGSLWAAQALEKLNIEPILGVNIGKSKIVPLEEAVDDYLLSFERLHRYANYIVINVSSPNTPGLRSLQNKEPLTKLLTSLQKANKVLRQNPVPILLKIAPDLSDPQLDDIAELAEETEIAGIIATNTTIQRDLKTDPDVVKKLGNGGVSGAPLTLLSRQIVAKLYQKTGGKLPIIGVGGIMNADDAWEMLRAGASLLQIYSGFIYSGPTFIRDLHLGILEHMKERNVSQLSEIIGENASSIG